MLTKARDWARDWAIARYVAQGVRIWLLSALGLGLVVLALLPDSMTLASRVTLGWMSTALTTLGFVLWLVRRNDLKVVKQRARRFDPSLFGHILFLICGAGASIVTTVWTLRAGGGTEGGEQLFHLLLAVATIFVTWIAIHSVFALHYAHLYYGEGGGPEVPSGGFNFPRDEGDRTPLVYSDFFYFAICAGMTFEASDVQVTQRRMRVWVTCHTVLAFLYNSVILALLVDIAATLVG